MQSISSPPLALLIGRKVQVASIPAPQIRLAVVDTPTGDANGNVREHSPRRVHAARKWSRVGWLLPEAGPTRSGLKRLVPVFRRCLSALERPPAKRPLRHRVNLWQWPLALKQLGLRLVQTQNQIIVTSRRGHPVGRVVRLFALQR